MIFKSFISKVFEASLRYYFFQKYDNLKFSKLLFEANCNHITPLNEITFIDENVILRSVNSY